MIKDLNYLFNETSLYTKEVFKVFHFENNNYVLSSDELESFFRYIGIKNDRLITYCHKCKKEFPFEIKRSLHRFSPFRVETNMSLSPNKMINLDIDNSILLGVQPPYEKEDLANHRIWYITYFFKCTNNSEHNYMMTISIELDNGEFIVRKVGQNPSTLSVKGFDFEKYKKQLVRLNAYEDYKKADLSHTEHFYVGAFAYLRRIFEKMVNSFIHGLPLSDDHMDTKIKLAKPKFDPRIHDTLVNLYGILSKSIHELDEEESKEYYDYLKAVIDIQLEYMKTEEDKDKQSKELSSILNTIASKFKN